MGVSKNRGFSPQIINFNRVFHEINHPFWGFSPYFWKHPYTDIRFMRNHPKSSKVEKGNEVVFSMWKEA